MTWTNDYDEANQADTVAGGDGSEIDYVRAGIRLAISTKLPELREDTGQEADQWQTSVRSYSMSMTLGFQGPYYWVLKGSRALTIGSLVV